MPIQITFWKPDYFYLGRYHTIASTDGWIGWDQGFGFFVLSIKRKAGAKRKNFIGVMICAAIAVVAAYALAHV